MSNRSVSSGVRQLFRHEAIRDNHQGASQQGSLLLEARELEGWVSQKGVRPVDQADNSTLAREECCSGAGQDA